MLTRSRSVRGTIGVGVAALLAAVVLGALIAAGALGEPNAVDAWVASVATETRSPATLAIALGLNTLGRGLVATLVVPAVLVVVLIAARRRAAAVVLVVSAAATWGLTRVLKTVVGRERPEDILVTSDVGSYPSGHASNAAVLAAIFFVVFRSLAVRIAAVLYLLAMMWSRVLLGAHWATDVVGGALVGIAVALLVASIAHRWLAREPAPRGTRG